MIKTDTLLTTQDWIEAIAKLDALLAGAGVGLYVWDRVEGIYHWSEGIRQMLSVGAGEVPSFEIWHSRLHPDDSSMVSIALDRLLEKGKAYHQLFRVVQPGGGVRWLDDTVQVLLQDTDGKPLRIAGLVRDVTEWQSPLQAALADDDISLLLQDKDLRYVWYHRPLARFADWPINNILGLTDAQVGFSPAVAADIMAKKRRVLLTGQPETFEQWMALHNGQHAYICAQYLPYTFSNGDTGILCKIRDLTEVQQARGREAELRQELERQVRELEASQARFDAALQGSNVTLFVQDEHLNYVWEHNVLPDYGLNGRLVGTSDHDFPYAPDAMEPYLKGKREVIFEGKELRQAAWFPFKLQGPRYIETTFSPFTLPNGRPGLIGKVLDLTETKQAQEREVELRSQLERKLVELDSSHRLFAAGLAQSPLTVFFQDEELTYGWAYNVPPTWGINGQVAGYNERDFPLPPETIEALVTLKKKVLATGEPAEFKDWVHFDHGEVAFCHARYDRYQDENGTRGLIGRVVNLTETKLAEERAHGLAQDLAETQARLDAGLQGEPFTIYIQDEELRYRWLYNIHPGWQEGDFLGKTDEESGLDAEILRQMDPAKRRVLATGAAEQVELWAQNLAGEPTFLRYRINPYTFADGKPGVIVKVSDLTSDRLREQKTEQLAQALAEQVHELQAADLRLTTALDEEPLSLWVQDASLRFLWARNFPTKIWPHNIVGLRDADLQLPPDQLAQLADIKRKVIETGEPFNGESWFTLHGGNREYYRLSFKPYPLPDGTTGLVGKAYELTDLKLAQEQVESLNKELQRQLAALGQAHNAKLAELQDARAIQTSLLPAQPPDLPGLHIAAAMQTSEEVGGDYYDFLTLPDGKLVMALGDATGHGLRAGFLVAIVKAYFQLLARQVTPAQLLELISDQLSALELKQMYMGLSVLDYDPATGQGSYVAAGMPPLRIFRAATGQVEVLTVRSLYLGTNLRNPLEPQPFSLLPGDVLVAATDGLFETRNVQGKALPTSSIDKTIAQCSAHHPTQLVDCLLQEQVGWQGALQPADDTTLVVLARP